MRQQSKIALVTVLATVFNRAGLASDLVVGSLLAGMLVAGSHCINKIKKCFVKNAPANEQSNQPQILDDLTLCLKMAGGALAFTANEIINHEASNERLLVAATLGAFIGLGTIEASLDAIDLSNDIVKAIPNMRAR